MHMLNFLESREKKSRPVADIEEGYISAASCIWANVAMQIGKTVHLDPSNGEVKDKSLEAYAARPYRGPWEHPSGGSGDWKPWEMKG